MAQRQARMRLFARLLCTHLGPRVTALQRLSIAPPALCSPTHTPVVKRWRIPRAQVWDVQNDGITRNIQPYSGAAQATPGQRPREISESIQSMHLSPNPMGPDNGQCQPPRTSADAAVLHAAALTCCMLPGPLPGCLQQSAAPSCFRPPQPSTHPKHCCHDDPLHARMQPQIGGPPPAPDVIPLWTAQPQSLRN